MEVVPCECTSCCYCDIEPNAEPCKSFFDVNLHNMDDVVDCSYYCPKGLTEDEWTTKKIENKGW